jgi:succinoglycan biosynthesis transport protein ExoP
VEAEFTEINRGYNVAKDHYDQLLQKYNASEIAQNMEAQAKGEQFRIVDPPSLPAKPAKPNLMVLNMMGLFGGLGVGFGLALFAEFRDVSIHSERDVEHYIPLPVLGIMPVIVTPESLAAGTRRRRLQIGISAAAVLLIVGGLGFLIHHGTLDITGFF